VAQTDVCSTPDRQPDESDSANGWLFAGYLGLAGFLAIEGLARERGSASSLKSSSDDQGTTCLLGLTYAFLAFAPAYLRRIPTRRLPRFAAESGLMMQLAGLGLRYWSMRTLKASYSRTLRSEVDQQVIDAGPYRLIRHPGYLGSLMTWTGFALTSRRAPVLWSVVALSGVYRYRITAEERMLTRDLAGYRDYTDRTKRLIPFAW
jgi:protein-S-isoprenylcysteine O-methyltransferase Ste14